VVSRIESGRHRTSDETLRRLVEALEGNAVLGFEFNTAGEQKQELVRLEPARGLWDERSLLTVC
jgi:hypothetical protein